MIWTSDLARVEAIKMEKRIRDYVESLQLMPGITYDVSCCRADGIYALAFRTENCLEYGFEVLLSEFEDEEKWKKCIRDVYMATIVLHTGDDQVFKDRYKEDPGEWYDGLEDESEVE